MNRPFDKAKYKALLEGLEATEVTKSDLEFSFRLDSEYYQKEYLAIEKLALDKNGVNLGTLTDFLIGPFGSAFKTENYEEETTGEEESNYRYIRGKDVKPFFLMNDDNKFIPESDFSRLQKYEVLPNDVLISVVGTLGNASIALEKELPAIFSCKSTILRNSKINSFYLLAYLNSNFGRKLLLRKTRGAVQAGLNLDDLKTLTIPRLSDDIQFEVEKLVRNANHQLELSQSSYKDAENLLLAELGLLNWQPTEKNTSVVSFANSFFATGRLDAEYYQPFYDEVEKIIKSKGVVTLEQICSEINYGTVPTSPYTEDESGIPYIKGMNIKNGQIKGELDCITDTDDLPDKFFTQEGDIIISQMGTVGDVGVVKKSEVGWLFASFTIRVRLLDQTKYNPLFVGLYIQKIAKEYYLKRNIAQASVRQNTDLPTIKNLYIPNVSIEIQNEIADLMKQSQTAQAESKKSLELAKKVVEVTIEQDEEMALKLIRGDQNNA